MTTSETKSDDDEPPFVLQNCSAMSRQAAMSPSKSRTRRGWARGWFGGALSDESSVSKSASTTRFLSEETTKKKETKTTTASNNSSVSSANVDKSLLPTKAPSSLGKTNKKRRDSKGIMGEEKRNSGKETTDETNSEPKLNKSLLPTNASSVSSTSVTLSTDSTKTELNPPSPKSLSPSLQKMNGSSRSGEENEEPDESHSRKNIEANDIANDGISPDELSRQKRREEIRQKTAWYEEYIRNHLAKHDGSLSSLNKEELVALGLFDKQRRLNRRMRLFGRRESEDDMHLADEELEQLLALAEECNQAQNDDAELEMLLMDMENNKEVDMDRLYHLELLSRQRVGEILNQEELEALHIFEETKKNKEDLDKLRKKQKDGVEAVDEKRLVELTLLERKRNDDKSMTNAELASAEIIEMRHEDARINKKDYTRLLRLKEQGIDVDEDRFTLLSLLDRRRNGLEITKSEAEMLDQYYSLREDEYLERLESKRNLTSKSQTDAGKEQVPKLSPLSGKSKVENKAKVLVEQEQQGFEIPDNQNQSIVSKKVDNSAILEKDSRKQISEVRRPKAETTHQQQVASMGNAVVETTRDNRVENSEVRENTPNSQSAPMKKFCRQLEEQGMPLAISFEPISDDDDSNISIVSFGDETYINDILMQMESRESDRKEECLEDAYTLYKRTIKKKKLPESEELLLKIFAQVLERKNTQMHDEDIRFKERVERAEQLRESRKQEAHRKTNVHTDLNSAQREREAEESKKPSVAAENDTKVKDQKDVEDDFNLGDQQIMHDKVESYMNGTQKNLPLQSISREEDSGEFPETSNNDAENGEVPQASESKETENESSISKQLAKSVTNLTEDEAVDIDKDAKVGSIDGKDISDASNRSKDDSGVKQATIVPSGNEINKEESNDVDNDLREVKVSKSEKVDDASLLSSIDDKTNPSDVILSRDNESTGAYTESTDDADVAKIVDDYLRRIEVNENNLSKDPGTTNLPRDSIQLETGAKCHLAKEDTDGSNKSEDSGKETDGGISLCLDATAAPSDSSSEEDVGVKDGKLPIADDQMTAQEIDTKEVLTVQEGSSDCIDNKIQTNDQEQFGEERFVLLKEGKRSSKTKAADLPVSGIDREEIEADLLYELDLVFRLRKGIELTEKQDYELDILQTLRRGGTISKEEVEDFELLRKEREELMLHVVYLRDLDYRISNNELQKDDIFYEVDLFHKAVRGENMSSDEKVELHHFERRLNGEILTKDDLEELEFLKEERSSRIGQRADDTKSVSISEVSSRTSSDIMRRLERSISGATSNHSATDYDSTDFVEQSVDDEDSVYRRDLLGRQMAGKRLDKKEFEWLQILTKKSRNEELSDDELDELEIMRNQRNETEVNFVNTKKLLEKELKRQNRNKIREQRRKEKEERKEQRRLEKKERANMKKLRRRAKSVALKEAGTEEKTDAMNSHETKPEVQIIGGPTLQNSRPDGDKKDEPKMSVFGAVFKNAKKQRQEQQLEEAKRLQEELIREQMKALALENEAEELEREKVMQEQLVQETIEKKRTASVIGSSFASSVGSASWDTSSAEKSSEESDDSSWTSWDTTSTGDDSRKSEEVKEIEQNENESKDNDACTELPQSDAKDVESLISELACERADFSREPSATSRETLLTTTIEDETIQIASIHSNHSSDGGKSESEDEVRPKPDVRGTNGRSSLGFHLKKKKKKRTKHGDDVSLGTLQLSKASKERRHSQKNEDKEGKSKHRPWTLNESTNITANNDQSGTAQNNLEENHDEKSASEGSAFDFNPSFISTISERDDEDEIEEESLSHVPSGTEEEKDAVTGKEGAAIPQEQSLIDSLANSFTSLGEEVYDLGLQEYDNIESRLGGKVKDKQAEFDLTWETAVADENVIIQINQRLKERQRILEAKREKKKEKKERKNLKEVPRLYLFEGERIFKKGKKRINKKEINKKINRTLTREFRKAMKDVFDSESDDDDVYLMEMNETRGTGSHDFHVEKKFSLRSFSTRSYSARSFSARSYSHRSISQKSFDDDDSDPSVYGVNDKGFTDQSGNNSDEESVKFDGEYLRRLKERSLPTDMKKMLSGRNMTSSRNLKSSRRKMKLDTSDSEEQKNRRRPKRKKTGEIVDPNIDPAEVYAQELEKQKEKKAFTIAGVRKEIEDINRNKNSFSAYDGHNFGDFDVISPSLLRINTNETKKTKKVSLGKGVESLERQRPKMQTMRSVRSLGTTSSDQGLLTGNRPKRRNSPIGLGRTSTIEEGDLDKEEDVILDNTRLSSDHFEPDEFEAEKLETAGVNGKKNNIKLFGAIKKTFKPKKIVELESVDGGGLLNGAVADEFDTSESKGGTTDESNRNAIRHLSRRDPLPLPMEEEDEIKPQRPNKMFEKVKIKGVFSKLKKLPGKTGGNRKFGGGIMMDD